MAALRTAGACGESTGACGIAERAIPEMSIVLLTAGEQEVNKVIVISRYQKIGDEVKGQVRPFQKEQTMNMKNVFFFYLFGNLLSRVKQNLPTHFRITYFNIT